MLNFDEARFLRIQRGAVAQLDPLRELVQRLTPRIDSLFFLGTGGAQILMEPAALLMQRRSHMPTVVARAAEIVVDGPANLGANALVVIPSLSGTTKESLAALDFAEERGGTVVSLVGHADTPLGKQADHAFVNFAEDDTSSESFYTQSLGIALALLAARGEMADAERVFEGLRALPEALLETKRAFEPRAAELAQAFRDEKYHILTGAGSAWPQAFYYGMCILEEMQWIRTRPVHASDFFHGTLELVEEGGERDPPEGRGPVASARRPRGEFRPPLHAEAHNDRHGRFRASRHRPGRACLRLAHRARHRAGAPLRAPGSAARASADDAPLLQARRILINKQR